MVRAKKKVRQQLLVDQVREKPFLTDEELATFFGVSIPTIRLDRLELGIPEMRERIKEMAREHASDSSEVIEHGDVAGEILDVLEGVQGISLLQTTSEMTDEYGVVDPQYLYAQANSLARNVIGAPVSVTGIGNIKYKDAVTANRKLIAKAEVVRKRGTKFFVWVFIKDKNKEVFRAKFIMETMNHNGM